jgi:hypothetical protein
LAVVRDKEEDMHSRWIFAVILGTFPAAAASAQQSHLDVRRQIEQLGRELINQALTVLRQSRLEPAFTGKDQKSTSNAPKWF